MDKVGKPLFALLLLLCACDPTMGELAKQYKGFATGLEKNLAAVKAAIDKAPPAQIDAECKPPKKLRFGGSKGIGNTEVVVYDEVADPAGNSGNDKAEMSLSHMSAVMTIAAWFFPDSEHYVGQPGKSNKSSTEHMVHTINQAKAIEYLIVSKIGAPDRKAGSMHADVFLVALADAKIACSYRVVGKADPTDDGVQYEHVEKNTKTGSQRVVGHSTEGGFMNNVINSLKADFDKSLDNKLALSGQRSH